MNLFDLQNRLKGLIKEPTQIFSEQNDCLDLIIGTETLSAQDRVAIYAEAYFVRITNALASEFKSVHRIVEAHQEHLFPRLIAEYLRAYPSRYTSLDEVGRDLSVFLRGHPVERLIPFIAELADLEWRMNESHFAPLAVLFEPSVLQQIPEHAWPDVRFEFDPSLRLIQSQWEIDRVWLGETDFPEVGDFYFLVSRSRTDFEVGIRRIQQAEFQVLQKALAGWTLGQISDDFVSMDEGREEAEIQKWFGDWVRSGILASIRPSIRQ